MSEGKLTRTVVVSNRQGLHLRPAMQIAQMAAKFVSKIELVRNQDRVNGKSMLEITGFAAEMGTNLVIEASGPDAAEAVEAIVALFASKFDEDNESDEERQPPS